MIDIGKIVARLLSLNIPHVDPNIGGVADLALTDIETETGDNLYVLHESSTVTPNEGETHVSQVLTDNVAICASLECSTSLDRLGYTGYSKIHVIRDDLFRALLGWMMEPELAPWAYGGDTLVAVTRARIRWQYTFTTYSSITDELLDTTGLDDFNTFYAQYIMDGSKLTGTEPLPIEPPKFQVPDFADKIEGE